MGGSVPYPALNRQALIGDRRTAALVAADGSINWLCLPDYDGVPVFGALLDVCRGGFWRVGPAALVQGQQRYPGPAPIAETQWHTSDYALQLTDAMARPADDRGPDSSGERVVLRRLTCTRGAAACAVIFRPACDFRPLDELGAPVPGVGRLTFWTSRPQTGPETTFRLESGETVWMVLSCGGRRDWTVELAEGLLQDAETYWADVVGRLDGLALNPRLMRSAVTIRLLEYAPSGSIVAAPTTSIPERIGGSWNADYRLTWVRDASLSMEMLARLGDVESASRYLEWLTSLLNADDDPPLQVLYTIRGGREPEERERPDLEGYRQSQPVRIGNHAFRQKQLDIFGYLADCAHIYLAHGGPWREDFENLLYRAADHVAEHWRDSGHGIWELNARQRYLSGRIMCWTALDRTLRIVEQRRSVPAQAARWRAARAAIREEVEHAGWSTRLGAFKQAIETDALDASALLVPLSGFLPLDDPRVVSTVDRIASDLTIDGWVYRFDPERVPQAGPSSMGQFETAFLPCTFWLATVRARQGRREEAEQILAAVERIAGPLGLYAEGIDPRGRACAGNYPLLFSHVEYMRAVQALACSDNERSHP